jgi:PAS domain S-box-containing protein
MTSTPDFRAFFEQASDGLLVLDASLVVIAANDALAALFGVPRERLIGQSIAKLIHPDDLAAQPLQTSRVQREGSAVTHRNFRLPGGRILETEIASSRMPDGALLCAVRPTARRAWVDQMRDSEARFRVVAQNLHAGLVVTDLENRIVYVNGYMCERTGYAAHELIGREVGPLLLAPTELPLDAERLSRRKEGVREMYEALHRRKDGTTFLGEVSASPLHDGDEHVIGTVGVVIDVTDRYEWERELAAREQRYRLLFEVMPLPAWVYDVESLRFLAVNPAAITHYGYSAETFLGMTILEIRPPEEVERVIEAVRLRRAGPDHPERVTDFRHRKANGAIIDVEVISHAFDFAGRAARIVVANDVTGQRRMRERERDMEAQLVQAHKMEAVGRLAGGVAHDFNNLLSVVLNAASALEAELPGSAALQESVDDIRQAVDRGARLTRQLLAFGRKEVHAPERVDVHAVLANVERLLARALGGQVRLELRRAPEPMYVLADASQLEQVLVNLAINARDAMPDGGTLVVTIDEQVLTAEEGAALGVPAGPFVSIEVADTGVGMDELTLARAFEPFFTTKGPNKGSGLGLATVYGIVRQSSGAVTLSSTPNVGTRVTVLLPRASAELRIAANAEGHARPVAARGAGTVLLVEDEPRVRAQARRLLERCGFGVIEAADGLEGERQFHASRAVIDAIVTDVVMPGLGGVEMVAKLRAAAPAIPVIYVSGFTAEDRDLVLDARTAFVPKPYSIAMLCDAIAAVVKG